MLKKFLTFILNRDLEVSLDDLNEVEDKSLVGVFFLQNFFYYVYKESEVAMFYEQNTLDEYARYSVIHQKASTFFKLLVKTKYYKSNPLPELTKTLSQKNLTMYHTSKEWNLVPKGKRFYDFFLEVFIVCWEHEINLLDYFSIVLSHTEEFFTDEDVRNVVKDVQKKLEISDNQILKNWDYLLECLWDGFCSKTAR